MTTNPVGGASCPAHLPTRVHYPKKRGKMPRLRGWSVHVGGTRCPATFSTLRLQFSISPPHKSIPHRLLLHLILTPPIGILLSTLNQTLPNRVLITILYYLIQRFFPSNSAIMIPLLPHRAVFTPQRVNLLCRKTLQRMHDTCKLLITIRLNDRMNMVRHYHNA